MKGDARGTGDVRRVVAGFAAVTVGEWTLGTAVAIAAFDQVGALAVGLVGFRFVPAAIAGLWTYRLSERIRRELTMAVTALTRTLAAAAVTLALALDLPFAAIVAIVWLDAAAGSAYRPAQAALLPAVVGTPVELTRAATLTSNAKTVGQVLGALIAGLVLSISSVAVAVGLATALYLAAALLTATVGPTARMVQWHQIPRTASVVARTQVTALEIPGAELRSVLAEDRAAAPSAG